ncbi:alpha mannosidase-like protein [Scheffersomyces spartinae]|uniref:alpha-1,2-Mannosidase n=1 Tax=Scheffersomyces spartinae TaxID=45513 RepID=A0A9P7VCW2_9ASCO|nr:alpha mannosidase-like protein [Scheffersomyces spartinae]KAG7194994.1 alpha mannosidase-like protein [Scheffersomyces spartinae]
MILENDTFVSPGYGLAFNSSFTPSHIKYLQNETKALFVHGWNGYMKHGFPLDEVRPLLCEPYGPDYDDIYDIIRNDAMGNTTLMILDNIDSLIIFEQWDHLKFALQFLKDEQHTLFEKDTIVQVFETTIRALGGLLSAHLLLSDVVDSRGGRGSIPSKYIPLKEIVDDYDGFLLEMAYDLGLKLLPAFKTQSSIPLPRINLLHGLQGVPSDLQDENCLAGATSPVLEFTLLSKLTGDSQFEKFSQTTFWKIWNGKLVLGLLPMTINPLENTWKDSVTGIGASGDSFYEYAAKSAIIFNDDAMWDVFTASYRSLLHFLAEGRSGTVGSGGMIFPNVHVSEGSRANNYIDLLSAFWSGLQVLTGQLSDAINTHLLYLKIWNTFDLIPERWQLVPTQNSDADSEIDKLIAAVSLEWYPLRPEFIESTYYLYRATRDPMYLQIGERVLNLLRDRYKAPCGFHGLQDVRTGERNDRMETFVLGETLKYLYLLFDVDNEIFLHSDLMKSKNWVFSTEAHPLWLSESSLLRSFSSRNNSKTKGDYRVPSKKRLGGIFAFLKGNSKQLPSDNASLFYKKTLLPNISYTDILDLEPSLTKKDAFKDRFYYCELNPFAKYQENQRFMTSGFYHWQGMFAADAQYNETLIRPSYLPKDDNQIEITNSFINIYGLIGGNEYNQNSLGQCPHPPTTQLTDIFMGDRTLGPLLEISKVSKLRDHHYVEGDHMRPNDLWVPEIGGVRALLEELRVGTYDSMFNFISKQYMDEIFNYPRLSRRKEKVLRVIRINGVQVSKKAIIWTRPFKTPVVDPQSQTVLLDVNVKNQIILDGVVIENWLFWKGGNTTRINFPN